MTILQAPEAHADWAEVATARHVLLEYRRALHATAATIGGEFLKLRALVHTASGQLITCGVGKSGLIARAIAAHFRENGKCSVFVHAAEAAHGAMGMLSALDVVLFVSHSGETAEVLRVLPLVRGARASMGAIVGNRGSTLWTSVDAAVCTEVEHEVCPHDLLPTTSCVVALALGQALAAR